MTKFTSCIGDSRRTFKLLNDIKGRTTKDLSLPALSSCARMEKSPSGCEIVEKFNEYFSTIGQNVRSCLPDVELVLPSDQNFSKHLYPTNTAKIEKIIHQLDNKSSSGVDNMSSLIV